MIIACSSARKRAGTIRQRAADNSRNARRGIRFDPLAIEREIEHPDMLALSKNAGHRVCDKPCQTCFFPAVDFNKAGGARMLSRLLKP